MRRRLALLVAATTMLVLIAFLVPLALLVRQVTEDRAIGRAEHEMRRARESGHGNDERWHLKKSGERFWAQGEMTPLTTEKTTIEMIVANQ